MCYQANGRKEVCMSLLCLIICRDNKNDPLNVPCEALINKNIDKSPDDQFTAEHESVQSEFDRVCYKYNLEHSCIFLFIILTRSNTFVG